MSSHCLIIILRIVWLVRYPVAVNIYVTLKLWGERKETLKRGDYMDLLDLS